MGQNYVTCPVVQFVIMCAIDFYVVVAYMTLPLFSHCVRFDLDYL